MGQGDIIKLLEREGSLTAAQIAKKLKKSRATLNQRLLRLVEKREIKRTIQKGTKKYIYFI